MNNENNRLNFSAEGALKSIENAIIEVRKTMLDQNNYLLKEAQSSLMAGFTNSSWDGIINSIKETSMFHSNLQSSMKSMFEKSFLSAEISREMLKIADWQNIHAGILNEIKRNLEIKDILSNITKSIQDSFNIPLNEFKKSMVMNNQIFKNYFSSFNDILEQMAEIKDKTDNLSITVNSDGTFSTLNHTFSLSEIEASINECIKPTSTPVSFEIAIYNWLKKVKLAHPLVAIFIVYILGQIILNVISGVMLISYQEYRDSNKIVKKIKEIPSNYNINNDFYNHHRFVSVKNLNVRNAPSVKGKIIEVLNFGQIVKIVKKNKNWSLVEWTKDDDFCSNGYVFTRYIEKFKKK